VDSVRWLARGMHDVPEPDDWLSPRESERLAPLRFPKRRMESRLARWTAKHAVACALGLDAGLVTLASIEIERASSGAPVVYVAGNPAPVAVSMTDRADWAVCAVAGRGMGVGTDLELVEFRTEAFVRDWFTPAERDRVLGAAPGQWRDLLANLVWSAKESALKVLETGLRRDTRSVEVDVIETNGEQRWARLAVRSEEGVMFPGWWHRYGDFLLTVVADVDSFPPTTMDEPPRLTSAVPSHSWLPKQ